MSRIKDFSNVDCTRATDYYSNCMDEGLRGTDYGFYTANYRRWTEGNGIRTTEFG